MQDYVHLMTTIILILVLTVLLVVIPILLSIRKRQKRTLESLSAFTEATDDLFTKLLAVEELIKSNFIKFIDKTAINDSTQISIIDGIKDIGTFLAASELKILEEVKTAKAIAELTKNKRNSRRNTPNKVKPPYTNKNGLNSRK